MARLRGVLAGLMSASGAFVSSLCCVLPVAIVLLGLGSGAFMATTMKYTPILVPIGVGSVTAGFWLHLRDRRRCAREGCRMAGGVLNLALLMLSAMVVATAVFFTAFPGASSDLLMWATATHGKDASHTMGTPMGSPR